MYEDNNYRIKIDWKGLLLKIVLIIIAILLIIWLFPMPKLDTFYNKIFNDNLNTMKTAAEKYFVGDNLPSSTSESITLKLQDMLDRKLVSSFTDKNNKSCNTSNSYAQATKTEANSYVLKVQLSCDDKTDYILENISTAGAVNNGTTANNSISNNTATSDSANTKDSTASKDSKSGSTTSDSKTTSNTTDSERVISKNTINNVEDDEEDMLDPKATYDKDGNKIEYEYKRAITKTSTSYSCPNGYIKENNVCYKYETGETINATPLYFDDVVTTTPAKVNKSGGYTKTAEVIKEVDKKELVCPKGYTLNDNICYKYVNVTVVPGSTTYSCEEGFTLDKKTNKCTKTVDATEHKHEKSEYYCTEGTLNGTKCNIVKDAKANTDSKTTYTCSEGTLSGNKCIITKNASSSTSGSVYYTCPRGGSLSGSTCTITNYANKNCSTSSGSYYCPNGGSLSGSNCVTSATYHAAQTAYTCPSGYRDNGSNCVSTYGASANTNWSNPSVQTSSTALSEYNNGSSKRVLANKNCTLRGCTYTYYVYTATVSYSCPSGGSLSGSTCYRYANKVSTITKNAYYSCNVGSLSGSSCYYSASYRSGSTSCSCPGGYRDNGSNCISTNSYSATKVDNTKTNYSCPSGYSLNGSKCTRTVDAKANTSSKTTYTCESGYTLNGTKCSKTTDAKKSSEKSTTYSCESGYTLNGTKCSKTVDAKAETTETKYTCPTGYVKDGTTCYQYTKPTEKITYKYSCPSGFIANGIDENMTCTLTVEDKSTYYCENSDEVLKGDKCVKTTKGALMGYTCPSGYIQNGDKCIKKSLICKPAEVITNKEVKYEYKWSTETNLEGWTQTGKTRGISIYSNNYEK